MPTLLLISHAFPPSGASGAHRPAKMAKFLSRSGWRVHVVTALARRYPVLDRSMTELIAEPVAVHRAFSIEIPSRRLDVGGEMVPAQSEEVPRLTRRRLPGVRWINRRVRSLLLPDELVGWIPFAAVAAFRIHARERCDAILSTAPELSNHLVGGVVSRATGLPWIADFRDPCAFNPAVGRRPQLHTTLLRRLERAVMQTASLTLATTEPMADFFRAEYPEVSPGRIRVLSNGFDPEDFTDLPATRNREFTVTHAGSLYGHRTLALFLEGVRALLDRSPGLEREVRCRFLGIVPEREQADIARLGLSRIVSTPGYIAHRRTLAELVASDLLLLLTGDMPRSGMYVPRKAYEYLGAGNPVLAVARDGAVATLVASTGAGVVVPPDEPGEIARALEAFLDARSLGSPLTKRSEEEVARYRWERIAGRLGDYLAEAAETRRA